MYVAVGRFIVVWACERNASSSMISVGRPSFFRNLCSVSRAPRSDESGVLGGDSTGAPFLAKSLYTLTQVLMCTIPRKMFLSRMFLSMDLPRWIFPDRLPRRIFPDRSSPMDLPRSIFPDGSSPIDLPQWIFLSMDLPVDGCSCRWMFLSMILVQ